MKKTVSLFLSVLIVVALLATGLTSCSAANDTAATRNKQAEKLVGLLYEKKYDQVEAMFEGKLKTNLPEASLKKYWENITAYAGKYQEKTSVTGGSDGESSGSNVYSVVTSVHANCNIATRVIFNDDGGVVGLMFNYTVKSGSSVPAK